VNTDTFRTSVDQSLFARVLDESQDGVAIADALRTGLPLVYVNKGFEKLTGYTQADAAGKNYYLLFGNDTAQAEIATIRNAITRGEGCTVTLRCYRKDGSMFWNQFSVAPVRDAAGTLTQFIGISRDMTDKIRQDEQLSTQIYVDPLTGIASRRRFDERFADLLHVAQRIHSGMSLLMVDLDHFSQFNQRYGQAAGDECLRKVGECIARSFKRTSDCVARYGGEEFTVVSFSSGMEALQQHALKLCEQVRLLNIPHSGSPHGIVTISVGGIHRLPNRDTTREQLISLAEQQLLAAKNSGRDQVRISA